jgi:hypothetical protein
MVGEGTDLSPVDAPTAQPAARHQRLALVGHVHAQDVAHALPQCPLHPLRRSAVYFSVSVVTIFTNNADRPSAAGPCSGWRSFRAHAVRCFFFRVASSDELDDVTAVVARRVFLAVAGLLVLRAHSFVQTLGHFGEYFGASYSGFQASVSI